MFSSPLFKKLFLVILAFISAFCLLAYLLSVPMIRKTVYNIEESAARTILNNVHDQVRGQHLAMEAYRSFALEAHRKQLKNIIRMQAGTVDYHRELVERGFLTEKEAKRRVLSLFNTLRFQNNDYVWVSDYDHRVLSHPDPALQGADMGGFKDIHGNAIIEPLVAKARENGEGYTRYWWQKLVAEAPMEKLAYGRDVPAWGWVLMTGVYIDDVEKELAYRKKKMVEELRETLRRIRIARTGYMYLFDSEFNMIIHPNPNIENTDFGNLLNPITGRPLCLDLVAAAGKQDPKLYYAWDRPDDKGNYVHRKISWIRYFKGFDWYIATSVYTDELNTSSKALKMRILLMAALLVIASLTVAAALLNRILAPIRNLSQTAIAVQGGDLSRHFSMEREDEIGALSRAMGAMVEKLRENIAKLENSLADRKAAQKQLVQSEKMAALGVLVAGVAHEINTPVGNGITGASFLAERTCELKEKIGDGKLTRSNLDSYVKDAAWATDSVLVSLTRAAELVNSFKQVATDQTTGERRVFNLAEYLGEVLLNLHSETNRCGHRIRVNCPDNLVIDSYPGAYAQIVSQLVINSVTHGFRQQEGGEITIDIRADGDLLHISYCDNGHGMPDEHRQKLFDPFFTTDRGSGTGLGMHIVYNPVTRTLGGRIALDNLGGKGLHFSIKIPVTP